MSTEITASLKPKKCFKSHMYTNIINIKLYFYYAELHCPIPIYAEESTSNFNIFQFVFCIYLYYTHTVYSQSSPNCTGIRIFLHTLFTLPYTLGSQDRRLERSIVHLSSHLYLRQHYLSHHHHVQQHHLHALHHHIFFIIMINIYVGFVFHLIQQVQ